MLSTIFPIENVPGNVAAIAVADCEIRRQNAGSEVFGPAGSGWRALGGEGRDPGEELTLPVYGLPTEENTRASSSASVAA